MPEIHSDAALRARHGGYLLHIPALMMLELGNVLAKKIRRMELTRPEGDAILKEMKHLPFQRHADERLFPAAYTLACETPPRSLYDCLYLALVEAVDGILIMADRKLYAALVPERMATRAVRGRPSTIHVAFPSVTSRTSHKMHHAAVGGC